MKIAEIGICFVHTNYCILPKIKTQVKKKKKKKKNVQVMSSIVLEWDSSISYWVVYMFIIMYLEFGMKLGVQVGVKFS